MLVRKFYFYLWEEQTWTNWKSRSGSPEETSPYTGHILEKRSCIQQLSMVFLKIPLERKGNLVRKFGNSENSWFFKEKTTTKARMCIHSVHSWDQQRVFASWSVLNCSSGFSYWITLLHPPLPCQWHTLWRHLPNAQRKQNQVTKVLVFNLSEVMKLFLMHVAYGVLNFMSSWA